MLIIPACILCAVLTASSSEFTLKWPEDNSIYTTYCEGNPKTNPFAQWWLNDVPRRRHTSGRETGVEEADRNVEIRCMYMHRHALAGRNPSPEQLNHIKQTLKGIRANGKRTLEDIGANRCPNCGGNQVIPPHQRKPIAEILKDANVMQQEIPDAVSRLILTYLPCELCEIRVGDRVSTMTVNHLYLQRDWGRTTTFKGTVIRKYPQRILTFPGGKDKKKYSGYKVRLDPGYPDPGRGVDIATAPSELVTLLIPSDWGQPDAQKLKIGDRVLAEWNQDWLPVKIIERMGDDKFRVHWIGEKNESTYHVSQLRHTNDSTRIRSHFDRYHEQLDQLLGYITSLPKRDI